MQRVSCSLFVCHNLICFLYSLDSSLSVFEELMPYFNSDEIYVNYDKIRDNRDSKVLLSYNGSSQNYIEEVLFPKTKIDQVLWIKYRYSLIHSVLAMYLLYTNFNKQSPGYAPENSCPILDRFSESNQHYEELINVVRSTACSNKYKVSLLK